MKAPGSTPERPPRRKRPRTAPGKATSAGNESRDKPPSSAARRVDPERSIEEPTNTTVSYFAGASPPALLSRTEEQELATRIVAARVHIQSLLARVPGVVRTVLPIEERGIGNPIEDFREHETLLVVDAIRAAAGKGEERATAIGFASAPELDRTLMSLNDALRDYREARDAMIEANLRLVLALARRYRRAGVPFLDLVQEGTLGLIRAVEKFDPVRDVRFGTYAVWWIWQQIGRAGDQHSALIRTPTHWNQLRRKIARVAQRLESEGLRFEREDLAEASGVDEERVAVVSQPFLCLSLAAPMGDQDDRPLEETIASDVRDPEHSVADADLSEQLERALSHLPEREADVLRWRFGTGDRSTLTLEEIGRLFGVSRERVRQIEARALKLLVPICEKRGLRAYVETR